jgi:hypothetical protein
MRKVTGGRDWGFSYKKKRIKEGVLLLGVLFDSRYFFNGLRFGKAAALVLPEGFSSSSVLYLLQGVTIQLPC